MWLQKWRCHVCRKVCMTSHGVWNYHYHSFCRKGCPQRFQMPKIEDLRKDKTSVHVRETLEKSYCIQAFHCQLASSETDPNPSRQPSWDVLLACVAWSPASCPECLAFSVTINPMYYITFTIKAIWLERQHSGTWNENGQERMSRRRRRRSVQLHMPRLGQVVALHTSKISPYTARGHYVRSCKDCETELSRCEIQIGLCAAIVVPQRSSI